MKIKLYGLLLFLIPWTAHAGNYDAVLKQLKLPVGFSISVFADNVPNARSMALADKGVIFIGTRQQGDVYAVRDSNGDGVADKRYLIASKLYMPNGVAYKDGALYVAETNRILRFDNIIDNLANPPEAVVIYDVSFRPASRLEVSAFRTGRQALYGRRGAMQYL